jgi:hypothetical protein
MTRRVLAWLAGRLHAASASLLARLRPEWHGRRWSNAELRRWSSSFAGDVINVSGWHDQDKEGGHYRDYFPNRRSYTISNVGGARGTSGHPAEIFLDLTADLPPELRRRYDVVFNHTVIEHIYEVRTAIGTLCALSRDVVILVVPFKQGVHFEPGSFLDYWRPTPFALAAMFEENGFHVVYCASNDNPVYSVYVFCIATSQPDRWKTAFPPTDAMALIAAAARP